MQLDLPNSAQKAPVRGASFRVKPFYVGLLLVILILILVFGLFFYRNSLSLPSTPKKDIIGQFQLDKIQYSDPEVKTSVENHLREALKSPDQTKAKEELSKSFFLLGTEYDYRPAEEIRNAMVAIKDYSVKKYPDLAKTLEPAIPCKQESCGVKAESNTAIDNLKKDIFASKVINDSTKEVFRINFDDLQAALSKKDKKQQYFQLESIFTNLKTVWEKQPDPSVGKLITATLTILKETDPEKYNFEEEQGFFKLT